MRRRFFSAFSFVVVLSLLLCSCSSDQVKSDLPDPELDSSSPTDSMEPPPSDSVLDDDAAEAPAIPTSSDANATAVGEPPPNVAAIAGGFKTKYMVIQEGYDRANSFPDVGDFDLLDDATPKTSCFSTKAADPMVMTEMVIKQMIVQVEGNPDYGPLFPGSTDHSETRLVIGKNNGWVNSANLTNDRRKVFELTRNSEALVIRIVENKFGIYQDIGNPAEVWLKKSVNGLIFFKVFKVDSSRKRNEVFIGYCYRKS